MISGSRSGLPHGHVFVKRNPNLTSEEQQILKEESNDVLDNRGFISPKKMLSWLTPSLYLFMLYNYLNSISHIRLRSIILLEVVWS